VLLELECNMAKPSDRLCAFAGVRNKTVFNTLLNGELSSDFVPSEVTVLVVEGRLEGDNVKDDDKEGTNALIVRSTLGGKRVILLTNLEGSGFDPRYKVMAWTEEREAFARAEHVPWTKKDSDAFAAAFGAVYDEDGNVFAGAVYEGDEHDAEAYDSWFSAVCHNLEVVDDEEKMVVMCFYEISPYLKNIEF
jgi:hypothetical protein